jgi:hypothetical protein
VNNKTKKMLKIVMQLAEKNLNYSQCTLLSEKGATTAKQLKSKLSVKKNLAKTPKAVND